MQQFIADPLAKNKVILYCIPNQEASARAREFLKKHHTPFEERDITTSAAYAQDMMMKSGQNTQPLIINGHHQWIGIDARVQEALVRSLKA